MAPSFSCSYKRPLDVVVYAAAAAAAGNKRARQEDEEEDEASTSSSSSSVALSLDAASAPRPFGDSKSKPISAVPISAVPRLPPPPLRQAPPAEPPCLREHFLEGLGLRADLPVHFIDVKHLTSTDLDPHQNRLRIPWDGAIHRLRPLLTPAELHAANLLVLPDPKPKAPKKRPAEEPQQDGGAADQGKKVKKPKAKGKAHGGLRVNLVGLAGGAKQLLLARWDSTHATIVKGEGYLDFFRRCGFEEGDAVEIWAFVQRRFRLFGRDVCGDSLLHILVVKKGQRLPPCRYCHLPPAAAVNPSTELVMA